MNRHSRRQAAAFYRKWHRVVLKLARAFGVSADVFLAAMRLDPGATPAAVSAAYKAWHQGDISKQELRIFLSANLSPAKEKSA